MSRLSLCIDARMKNASGIGTYLRNLIPFFLQSELFDITLLEAPYPIYSLQEQLYLPKRIPPCDFFWSPHFNVPLLPIQAAHRIVTIHDVFLMTKRSPLKFYEKWYARFLLHQAVHSSSLIFTVSEFSKQEIQRYFKVPEEKIVVIYSGIDHALFSCKKDPTTTLKKYGIQKPYFLFVGNLKPHKNVEGLLQAYILWQKRYGKNVDLIFIGQEFSTFPFRQKLEEFVEIKDSVHFLTTIDDQELPIFYQNALATVLPSFYEGFGFPPLEAMSARCPVIISNTSSLPEICGEAALAIDPYHPHALFKALETVVYQEKTRQDLILAGQKRVACFRWDKAAAAYVDRFLDLDRRDIGS